MFALTVGAGLVAGFQTPLACDARVSRVVPSSSPPHMSLDAGTAFTGRRRALLEGAVAAALLCTAPEAALASGGATAGKYTTIPIAKRRYYGRVKQGVFEYLAVGDAVGSAVGSTEGSGRGTAVGTGVGSGSGTAVGAVDGLAVGRAVGGADGSPVGSAVGKTLGAGVGEG